MSRSDEELEKGGPIPTDPEERLPDYYSYIDEEEPEDAPERSLFEQWWFRAILAGVALLVVAVIALPYLLERSPAPTRSAGVVADRSQSEPVSAREESPPPAAPAAPTDSEATKPSDAPTTLKADKPHPPAGPPPVAKPDTRPAPPAPPIAKVRQTAPATSLKAATVAAPTKQSPARKHSVATNSKGAYWVQVGAFKNSKYATRLAARIIDQQYPVEVSRTASSAIPLVVRVGSYSDRQKAEAVRADLERKGFPGFVLKTRKR